VRWGLAALGAALSFAGAAPAWGYVRTHVDPNDDDSPCLFWGRRTVPYQLSARGMGPGDQADVFAALRRSLQQWTDVGCSDFAYQDDGLSQSLDTGFNITLLNQPMLVRDLAAHNVVLFRSQLCADVVPAGDDCEDPDNDDCENTYDCWNYPDGVIALTTTTYNFETGEIFNATMELNQAEFDFTTVDAGPPCLVGGTAACIGTDLRNTVTHESGHMLGLGHSLDPTATMYFSAGPNETSKRDLAPDDIQALCDIYPPGQPALTCGDAPKGNPGCGCSEGDGFFAVPLVLLGLAWRRRRRAR